MVLVAKSTGLILTATAISGTNEWLQTKQVPWRIGLAGLAAALLFDGMEHIYEPLAVGMSVVVFVTVMFTPFNGVSPAEEAERIFNKG
jgi:hypothetical protein